MSPDACHLSCREDRDRLGRPDVLVQAELGELRAVLLLKFLNDFLLFLDPFTNMKEFITEQAQGVYDRSARIAEEAYSKATKVKLNIDLTAPIIVLPVSSRKPFTFEANLGNLTLNNKHHNNATRHNDNTSRYNYNS